MSKVVLKNPFAVFFQETGRLLSKPSGLINIYKGHMHITMTRYMAYRVELVIWLISMIVQPVVFMTVWQHANISDVSSFNWTDGKFASYFILSMMINHATMAWVMWEWEYRVKTGELSYLLLRPQFVIHRDLGENLTFKIATFPVMFLTALGLVWAFKPEFEFNGYAVAVFCMSFILTFALRFLFDWVVSLLAIFTVHVMAINVCYIFLMLLFSGQIGPIPLLPPMIQTIANFLPFKWMIDFPIRLVMGELTQAEILFGLMCQLGWVIVIILIGMYVWRKGVRKWTAVGL